MILCDIGNTTYHFLDGKKDFKVSVNDDITKLKLKGKIFFVSVNAKATKKLKKTFPEAINLKKYFQRKTHYATTLGIDRKVACANIKDGVVVDVGSAITIDIIQKNIHMGGFILPGFDKLKEIYPKISKKLVFHFENEINLDKIPTNTNDAINYAIFTMVVMPIKDIQKKYNLKLVFTGENSKLLFKYFDNYKFKSKLIFKNMKRIIKKKGLQ
jgi:type III pantothenate kinase